jgi:proteasome lid subunit RPN8/RPN11
VRPSIRHALAVLLSLAPQVAFTQSAVPEDPEPAPPAAVQPEQVASDPLVRAYLADLLRLAGGGYRLTERAAFLVAAGEGGYRCLLWPYHTAVQREVFRGRIPPRTIAVLHTHPNSMPRPSTEDRHESRRLGLPFIVASARHIYAVGRAGEVAAVVENRRWSDGTDRARTGRCEPLKAGHAEFPTGGRRLDSPEELKANDKTGSGAMRPGGT